MPHIYLVCCGVGAGSKLPAGHPQSLASVIEHRQSRMKARQAALARRQGGREADKWQAGNITRPVVIDIIPYNRENTAAGGGDRKGQGLHSVPDLGELRLERLVMFVHVIPLDVMH